MEMKLINEIIFILNFKENLIILIFQTDVLLLFNK
jgi:hypothetical protein